MEENLEPNGQKDSLSLAHARTQTHTNLHTHQTKERVTKMVWDGFITSLHCPNLVDLKTRSNRSQIFSSSSVAMETILIGFFILFYFVFVIIPPLTFKGVDAPNVLDN